MLVKHPLLKTGRKSYSIFLNLFYYGCFLLLLFLVVGRFCFVFYYAWAQISRRGKHEGNPLDNLYNELNLKTRLNNVMASTI